MNWLNEISSNKIIQAKLHIFLAEYGIYGLEHALQLYTDMQQVYFCCTRTSSTKLKIHDIYYLEIRGHNIIAHTENSKYSKYGSLNNELKTLSKYGFIKCNQSCIVSLLKIKTICSNDIILLNNDTVHMTRNYARKVIMAFHNTSYVK